MSTERPATGIAASVNAEAGLHAVSLAPGHAEAAVAATRRSWQTYPYYAARYGERGWRFSLSDSGWLETLLQLPETDAIEQMRWLRRLLQARGMPSVLLESHLAFLAEELVARGTDASLVGRLAGSLREERQARVGAKSWNALCGALAAVGEIRAPGNLAPVFLSALIDEPEAPGLTENVRRWVVDSGVFPPVWIAQLNAWLTECAASIGIRYHVVGIHNLVL